MPTEDQIEPVEQATQEPPQIKLPKWFPFLLTGLVIVVLYIFISPNLGDQTESIRTEEELQQATARARQLSEAELQKWANGERLTNLDMEHLRKAKEQTEAIVGFSRDDFIGNMLSGQILYVLDEDEKALERLQRAISVGQKVKEQTEPLKQNIAHAYYVSSLALFDMKRYRDAAEQGSYAFLLQPKSPDYAVAVASAAIQLNEVEEAKKFLNQALKLNPNHARAQQLLRFLGE